MHISQIILNSATNTSHSFSLSSKISQAFSVCSLIKRTFPMACLNGSFKTSSPDWNHTVQTQAEAEAFPRAAPAAPSQGEKAAWAERAAGLPAAGTGRLLRPGPSCLTRDFGHSQGQLGAPFLELKGSERSGECFSGLSEWTGHSPAGHLGRVKWSGQWTASVPLSHEIV